MNTPIPNQIIREITPLSDKTVSILQNVIKRNLLIRFIIILNLN